jgi:hypothetical protein
MALPGIDTYTVTVSGGYVRWTTQVTNATMLRYPDDAPPLEPGVLYSLTVYGGMRSSDEEGTPGLGFSVLTTSDANAVFELSSRVQALGLPDTATRFVMSQLYASWGQGGQGLNAEAIDLLVDMANSSPEPAIERALGERYLTVGLTRLAEQSYVYAAQLSQDAGDIEGQALADNALGTIYEQLGNEGGHNARLQLAAGLYSQLGDQATVDEIQNRLAVAP